MKKNILFIFFIIIFYANASEVLIVSAGGNYKKEIQSKLNEEFRKKGFKVKLIKINKINKENAKDYDVLIILDTIKGGRPSNNLRKFYEKNKDYKNIITYVTSGTDKWKSKENFDIIAGASDIKKSKQVVFNLIKKADEILKK